MSTDFSVFTLRRPTRLLPAPISLTGSDQYLQHYNTIEGSSRAGCGPPQDRSTVRVVSCGAGRRCNRLPVTSAPQQVFGNSLGSVQRKAPSSCTMPGSRRSSSFTSQTNAPTRVASSAPGVGCEVGWCCSISAYTVFVGSRRSTRTEDFPDTAEVEREPADRRRAAEMAWVCHYTIRKSPPRRSEGSHTENIRCGCGNHVQVAAIH